MHSRKKSRLRILILVGCAVVAVSTFLLVSTLSSVEASEAADGTKAEETSDTQETAIPVEVTEVARGVVSSYIVATANLVPEHQVRVLAEAEGRVTEVKVEEGDRVGGQQALAVLNPDEAEIAMNKARLKAANAELAMDRAHGTLEQGLISREEFDRLKMEYEVGRQEVAEAEWSFGKTTIRAPFAGRVTERMVEPGQHVRRGDALYTIADFDPLIARIYLPEKDVLQLDEGREVRISLAADSSLVFAGTVRQISPVVDTATGTVKVTVEANSPPPQVRPGAFVSIDIVRERKSEAVLLPRESVVRELRSAHVFVADGDTAAKRAVTLGLEEDGMIEVLSGVTVGERVVVAGQGGLKPGSKIKIL